MQFNGITILNLTPHPVTLFKEDGSQVTFESNGYVRLKEKISSYGFGILPIVYKKFNGIELRLNNIKKEDIIPDMVMYVITSCIVAKHLQGDLFEEFKDEIMEATGNRVGVIVIAPDTGPDSVVRDDKGNVIGVRRFCRFNFV